MGKLLILYFVIAFLGICMKNHKTAYIVIITGLFIFFSGMRNLKIGVDTQTYYSLFEQSKIYGMDIPLSRDMEPGYLWFQMMFSRYIPSFQMFLVFITVFFHVPLAMIIKRYSPDPMWSFLLYQALFYTFFGFTGLRQTLAMSFCLFSVFFIEKKKFIPFLCLVLLGISFHSIAVVFLPAYFLLRFKITKKYLILCGIVIALTMIFQLQLYQELVVSFANLTDETHYLTYGSVTFAIQTYAMYTYLLTFMVAIFYKKTLKKHPTSRYFYNCMLVGSGLIFTGLQRLTMFYTIGLCIILPCVMDAFEDKRFLRFAQKIMLFALFFLYYKSIDITHTTMPFYRFFWNP